MGLIDRLISWFVRVNQILIGAAMGTMALLVGLNVICRYAFGFSLSWTEELSRFLMIAITYLGAGLALREGRLVAVEFLQDKCPNYVQFIRLFVAVIIVGFLFVLACLGYQFAMFAVEQETPVLGISAAIPYMIIPVGAAITALHLLMIIREFLDRNWFHDSEDEEDIHALEYGQE